MEATPTATSAAAIEVHGLRKRYGATVAVADVSFSVAPGEIFGIAGPNGAGKTTTVECLQGLRQPDGGTIRVLGLDPLHQRQALRRRIGSQLQESSLPDRMKVWEALDLFASFVPMSSASNWHWRALLAQWGLAGKEQTAFADLSGGQQQRLFIALALVNQPELVFLDELTRGLDPAARRVAWELIRAVRDQGTTVVLVTHFMDEAEQLCDRLAIIDGGRVVALDTPQALISRYGGTRTVRFSSDQPDLSWLEQVPHVQAVRRRGSRVEVVGDGPVVALVAAELVGRGMVPEDLWVEQPTLEDAFLRLTERHGQVDGSGHEGDQAGGLPG